MTDTSPEFRSASKAGKRSTPNISGGWLVMILSFLIAMVVYFYVTQQSNQLNSIAVAASDIGAGGKVTASSFREVKVNVPRDQLNKMLSFDDIKSVDGYVTSSALSSGDPVLKSVLRPASAPNGLRAMSLPTSPERAVAGSLTVGDRVDVVDVAQSAGQRIVARNLEVLAISNTSGGGLAGGSDYAVTVAITPADAEPLSAAINTNKFDLIRSTGATPLTVSASSGVSSSTTVTTSP